VNWCKRILGASKEPTTILLAMLLSPTSLRTYHIAHSEVSNVGWRERAGMRVGVMFGSAISISGITFYLLVGI
jgi:hypothetical protein